MDIGALLKPIDDAEPSGPNLEYESAFTDMELAGQYGEESQVGDVIKEAEEPDFGALQKAAYAVLEQAHDMRAAIYLGEAVLRTRGIAGFADVTGLIRGFVEDYWETFHPQLDEDDGDPMMRVNATAGLCDGKRLLRALRHSNLTVSRIFGPVTLRAIQIADGEVEAPAGMENPPDSATISAAFQDGDAEELAQSLTAVQKCIEDINAVDAVFDQQTPGEGPSLDPIKSTLRAILSAYSRFADLGEEVVDTDSDEPEAEGAPREASGGAPGTINSRSDVTAALEKILIYYEKNEPSSPLPILINRAKRLVGADFMTIIQDIASSSMDEVRTLSGVPEEY